MILTTKKTQSTEKMKSTYHTNATDSTEGATTKAPPPPRTVATPSSMLTTVQPSQRTLAGAMGQRSFHCSSAGAPTGGDTL